MQPPCARFVRFVPSLPARRPFLFFTALAAALVVGRASPPARGEPTPPAQEAPEPERPSEADPAPGAPPTAPGEGKDAAPAGRADEPRAGPEPAEEGEEVQPTVDPTATVVRVPEVAISAARSERDVLDVPGNVTVLDRETIDRSGARDVPDLLRREAGVFVTNTTTNREGYTVEFRGFNNGGGNGSSTLVMIDGRRVNEPSSSSADWAFIPLDAIESIEVVRGPASALYGDNALAGVIHIRTRRAEEGLTGVLRGRTGSYDTDGGSLWVGGGSGPVRASAYLEGESTDGYRDRSDLRNHRGQMDVSVDVLGRGTLGVRGGYDSQVRQRPGALTPEEIEDDRRQAAPGSDDDFDHVRERYGNVYGDVALTEYLTLRLDGWHRRRDDRNLTTAADFRSSLDLDSDANGLGTWLELDVAPLEHRLRSILGVDLLQEDHDADSEFELFVPAFESLRETRSRRRIYGIFFQSELNLTDDLILSGGVRRDSAHYRGVVRDFDPVSMGVFETRFKLRHEEWAPKGALTWRVCEPVSLYVSYARGFRFPNFDEAFGVFGFSPGLVPQTSDTYETGLKVRTERVSLNAAVYHMDVEDEIFLDPLAPNPLIPGVFGVNVNIDRVRHRGLELWASVRPTDWLELYGSYTLDDVKFQHDSLTGLDGFRLPITPRHRGTAGAIVTLPYGFEVGVNANYVGSRFIANDVTNSLDKLPRFATYDVRVGWRHEVGEHLSLLLDATAYNVTGREYEEFGGVSLFSPRVAFYPAPERHYLVGARVELRL
jgi:outer membrane receptor protein involved in Fe transport